MADKLPLSGIRVIELADGLGEMCGRMLGDFGAEVIKVEPPEGAVSRQMSPVVKSAEGGSREISCCFEFRNFNKKSITLDLQTEDGTAQLKQLLESTDILIESFKPGQMEELGLSPEKLQAEFPHLIITSITPFGQTGPYARYEATTETIFALSGWLSLSGIPEKPPITAPGYMAYDVAGIMGCFASLAAMIKRFRTGMGQHIDVSAMESLAQCATWGLVNVSATLNAGQPPVRMRSGNSPLYSLFPTSDGMVRLVILSPRQWQSMWEWLGKPEEFADPIWEQAFQRIVNADVINPYFTRLFEPMKMEQCAKEAQERGVVVTPLLKPSDIIKNEHFISRNTFTEQEVASGASGKLVDGWMEINSKRVGLRLKAPESGQHTQEVLSQKLDPIKLVQSPDDDPALSGIRVMDFGHGGVGVEGSKLLAEYGADVIKIESRTYPDFIRTVMGSEMSPSFASSSRSKRSLGVNAKNPQGNKVLQKLAEISDIVIENNSTGTMDSMGLGYKDLKKLNPLITMASSQMMGSHGAYGKWIGYGPTIATVGGIDWLWGFNDSDPPPGTSHIHPDHMAGRICAIAGLLGIISRERFQTAFHAEMAQVENLMATLGDLFLAESLAAGSIVPQGNNSGGDFALKDAAWGNFLCGGQTGQNNHEQGGGQEQGGGSEAENENWCTICVRSEAEWESLVELIGRPEWADKPELKTREGRLKNLEQIHQGVSEWTSQHSYYEVMEMCQSAGVPAGAMLFYDDFITDPQYVKRGFPLLNKQQGVEGELYFEGAGFKASNMPDAYFAQAPELGEHTHQICTDLLGISDTEIDELIEAGALEISAPV